MTDIFELLRAYQDEFADNGYADPQQYLAKVEGVQRAELAGLIDAFLDRAPAREPDDERESAADRVGRAFADAVGRKGGLWPIVLPRLRMRARLRRGELTARLAEELNLAGKEGRVAEAYHELETGRISADEVRRPVLEALGSILGQSAGSLRELGRASGTNWPEGAGKATVFARTARGQASPAAPASPRTERLQDWDEVDELFRGGTADEW